MNGLMLHCGGYAREDDNIILMYIEFGMAQKYVDDLSKNVKRGLKTKIENGWYPGIAPLGYLNNTNKQTGENTLIKDPERFPVIRRIWDLMLSGLYTPPKILEIANSKWCFRTRPMRKLGGKPLCRSAIYKILTKPFYCGSFEYPKGSGKWYEGRHEPMVSQAEFDRVQTLLGRNGNPRPRGHCEFAFTGLIRCGECGSTVTAEEKHQVICGACRFKFAYRARDTCPRCSIAIGKMPNPRYLHYTYYHCARKQNPHCRQKVISLADLEHQIDQFIARIHISQRFKEWAVKYLSELHDKEVKCRTDVLQAQQKSYRDCLGRIDGLVKLKTSPGNADGILLSDEEYGRQRIELLKEKAVIEELLKDTGQRAEQWWKLAEQTFEFACAAQSRFAQGDSKTKKEILATIGSNLTLKDKKLCIEAKKPFFIIEESLSAPEFPVEPIEPENVEQAQGRKQADGSLCLTLRGGRYDVRTLEHRNKKLVKSIYTFYKRFKGTPTEIFPGWLGREHSVKKWRS
jgi:site-specific DNA recombinase